METICFVDKCSTKTVEGRRPLGFGITATYGQVHESGWSAGEHRLGTLLGDSIRPEAGLGGRGNGARGF